MCCIVSAAEQVGDQLVTEVTYVPFCKVKKNQREPGA